VRKTHPSRHRIRMALAAACLAASAAAQPAGTVSGKLSIKGFMDFGQLVNGSNPYGNVATGDREIASLPLNRMNVSAIQDIDAGRLDVSAGLSALVWWPYDGGISSDLKQRIVTVKPMIPVARARWRFGDTAGIAGSLQLGSFNYKYNPDARNLGEYLYRSGTYPGFVWSNDGWLLMNRAGNYSHGVLATIAHGRFRHNLSLFMEMLYAPVGDFSPGYDFGYKGSWLEFGGGVVLNHYLPIRPSALRPRNDENLYVRVKDARPNAAGGVDTIAYYMPKTEIPNVAMANPQDTAVVHRWTSQGVKLMARAALDLGRLLPEDLRGPEDLRLFGEVAVLGWGNQPLFYEKRGERIPVMLGLNVPTFRLLDLLSVQVEYYKSPYNDIDYFNSQSIPIWKTSFAKDSADAYLTDASGRIIPVADHKDDLKWSVHARKTVNKSVTVFVQAASDHFRLTDADYRVTPVPLTGKPQEWYYLLRLEFALR
jgi:hypothetical protein